MLDLMKGLDYCSSAEKSLMREFVTTFSLLRGVFFDIRDKSSSGQIKNYTANPKSVSESTSVELQMVPKCFSCHSHRFPTMPSKVGYLVRPLRSICTCIRMGHLELALDIAF